MAPTSSWSDGRLPRVGTLAAPPTAFLKKSTQINAGKVPMISQASTQYRVEGSGPLLIYIAGLDGTGQLFFKQAPLLTHAYRVVTFRSRDNGQFTYDDLADDIAAIIRDLGEQRATILGESFGGTVALNFSLRYPGMVERLVVINSFPRFRNRVTIKLGVRLASGLPFRLLWPVRRAANI